MVDAAARRLLESDGWRMPDEEALPTGSELIDAYLEPLAAHYTLAPHIHYGRRVTAVTRLGFDKLESAGRDGAPFEVLSVDDAGHEARIPARAVIDASGTYTMPNPIGTSGIRVAGELEHRDRIRYAIPDVRGRDRGRYAGRRTLVLGSGHSAFNALLDLAWLKTEVPDTDIIWAVRRRQIGLLYGGVSADALPARGSLGGRLRQLVDIGVIEMVTDFRTTSLETGTGGILVHSGERTIGLVDQIVAATGFRPELGMLRELRLALDPALESPVSLAPLIDPNVHSCGTVYPHGYMELSHPEPGFFIVGMKSYGRAPTFLLLTGYEQVRSVTAALAGDIESARDVKLALPGTGVCSTDLDSGSACCGAGAGAAAACG
jgi:hypothetical protein